MNARERSHKKNKNIQAMKKIIKESKEANTHAEKQACNMLAGQHPNIKQAPENKLFSKLAR